RYQGGGTGGDRVRRGQGDPGTRRPRHIQRATPRPDVPQPVLHRVLRRTERSAQGNRGPQNPQEVLPGTRPVADRTPSQPARGSPQQDRGPVGGTQGRGRIAETDNSRSLTLPIEGTPAIRFGSGGRTRTYVRTTSSRRRPACGAYAELRDV